MTRILIACEFSGTVRRAFTDRGYDAWSCDLLPAYPTIAQARAALGQTGEPVARVHRMPPGAGQSQGTQPLLPRHRRRHGRPVGTAAGRKDRRMTLLLAAACIASVHDGDTVRLCSGERVRLAEIDAPELPGSPSCIAAKRGTHWCDDPARAVRSRDALAAFLRSGPVRIERQGRDRYGRTLARLSVNGRDAGRYLVSLRLARWWR